MGVLRDYLSGKTGKKIAKTKRQVKDVQALIRMKRGIQPANQSGMQRVHRATARTGVGPGMFR